MSNRSNIEEMIAVFAVFYPRTFEGMSSERQHLMAELWTQKLARYDAEELMAAVDRITSKMKWMPSFAEVIEEIELARNPLANLDDEWTDAFAYACYPSRTEVSPLAKEVAISMGISRLQNALTKDMGWLRKEFIEIYEAKRKEGYIATIENRLPEGNTERIGEARQIGSLLGEAK